MRFQHHSSSVMLHASISPQPLSCQCMHVACLLCTRVQVGVDTKAVADAWTRIEKKHGDKLAALFVSVDESKGKALAYAGECCGDGLYGHLSHALQVSGGGGFLPGLGLCSSGVLFWQWHVIDVCESVEHRAPASSAIAAVCRCRPVPQVSQQPHLPS